jgi:hypothetical protein
MTDVKQQRSNDELRGLFSLEPYTLRVVGIDKLWPIHTSSFLKGAINASANWGFLSELVCT